MFKIVVDETGSVEIEKEKLYEIVEYIEYDLLDPQHSTVIETDHIGNVIDNMTASYLARRFSGQTTLKEII